ncbi:acetaldehyde dehydrogenase [Streptomyces spiroverticillatus]|uniref:Acetaldehyde dehydrogenase n=1 Tax=Streptomyces finlayi TaxID=67296 RepID=A0A918X9L9_9ACTN|nr:acetaldehyde dehydrogenase (acetylating) [Streptomyces finlayi]GHA50910.1 acetaldehyde dehydrogenase [Streptomyces spiroverticillatus]GHD20020.1 acetaldehyde dehydrogenase [Streptomyces finlayi]
MSAQRTRVAILGAGLIGIDLIDKIQRSPYLDCALVAGRTRQTAGLRRAEQLGCATAPHGIRSVLEQAPFGLVFDASNATAGHWAYLEQATDTTLIDLTPARPGLAVVPTVNAQAAASCRHIGLVSCGGQAALPLLHALAALSAPTYIEVAATAASASAGPATRRNLDEYLATTSAAISTLTRVPEVKVLANLSPARPAPPFRVAMTLLADTRGLTAAHVVRTAERAAHEVRQFAPGYQLTSTTVGDGQITAAVEVTAASARLPRHAGNLDLINAAAVLLAEQHTRRHAKDTR